MATVVTKTLVDDLDGGEANETVRVGLNGKTVELDLSTKNVRVLQKFLKPYLDNGRSVSAAAAKRGRPAGSGKKTQGGRDYDLAALRKWASSKRIVLPARGRIPGEVVERFKAEMAKR